MYCTKCGNKNEDGNNFCGYCGAALKSANQNGTPYVEPDVNNQQNQNTNPYYNNQQNGYYNQYPKEPIKRNNSFALAGFIVSCGGIAFGGLAGLVGIILSLIGFHQTNVRNEKGKGFAVAGIIIGCLFVCVTILLIIYMCNASPYELRRFFNDYYYEFDYGTSAVKDLLSTLIVK